MNAAPDASLVDLRHAAPSAPALAGCVRGMVAVAIAGRASVALCSVPHGTVALSVQLGAPLASREEAGVLVCGSAITGLRTRAVRYEAAPGTRTVVALLAPLAASRLLDGMPLGALTDQRVALDELLAVREVRGLADALRASFARDPFRAVEGWLVARIVGARTLPPDARRAGAALTFAKSAPAGTRVPALAEALGSSRRQLERDCGRWLGLTPHQLLAHARLQRALALLRTGTPLARAASAAGYADQAHMARALSERTGRAPSAWSRAAPTRLGRAYAALPGGELVTH